MNEPDLATGIVYTAAFFAVYFLPTIVCINRRHLNSNAISILNLLLGWTLIGWVVAIIWAMTASTETAESPASMTVAKGVLYATGGILVLSAIAALMS